MVRTSELFSQDHTLITKGILIIMMLVHHLFTQDLVQTYAVRIAFSNATMHQHISECCKMCISGYAFLSAFGMTCSLKKMNDNTEKAYFKFVVRRIIKLEASLIFIYIVAILFKRFVMIESIRKVYENGNGFSFVCLIIDMLGMAEYFGTPTVNITWWYMSYALLLVIIMPLIYMLYKRYGLSLLMAVIGGAVIILQNKLNFAALLPSVLLGIAFASEGWFEKLSLLRRKRIVRIGIEVVGIWFTYLLYCDVGITYIYAFAFLIPMLVFDLISSIPFISHLLKFLGKHSTNIFLTHTFIYYYFFTEYIYSLKYDWLILIVMLSLCSMVSMVLEFVKKLCGYNKLTNNMVLLCEKTIENIDMSASRDNA